MPVTAAVTGMGAIFSIGDGVGGSSTLYTKVTEEITNITPPRLSREALDATHLESPDDAREFRPGLVDGQESTITFNYKPSASDVLFDAFAAGEGDFQITYKNGVKLTFSGVVTGWKPGDPSTSIMTGEFTIKPSGLPVLS